jgi:hypothetical protein
MFKKITGENRCSLDNPPNGNMVYYSQMLQLYTANGFIAFSVTYFIEECITYKNGKKEHHVKASNHFKDCHYEQVEAYNRKPIRSIRIDVYAATMQKAYTILTSVYGEFLQFSCRIVSTSLFLRNNSSGLLQIYRNELAAAASVCSC